MWQCVFKDIFNLTVVLYESTAPSYVMFSLFIIIFLSSKRGKFAIFGIVLIIKYTISKTEKKKKKKKNNNKQIKK